MDKGVWYEIKAEISRTYVYPAGEKYTVEAVISLKVSHSGTHYLQTASGQKIIMRCGWLAIVIDAPSWSAT